MQVIATLFAQGTDALVGDITEVNDSFISITFKKPRSSKYASRTFPRSQVLAYTEGEEGELNGEVVFKGRVAVLEIAGELEQREGQVTVTTEDGQEYNFAADADLEIEAEAEEPGAKSKGKKAKPEPKGKPAGKAKPVKEEEEEEESEEESEEEEEQDEEEEEEAPAPKGKAGAKAKPGAKADKGAKAKPAKAAKKDEDGEDW